MEKPVRICERVKRMRIPYDLPFRGAIARAGLIPLAAVLWLANPPAAAPYEVTNLVSDIPGVAAVTDPHLVNPWGIASSSSSPFWVSDNGTGVATLYSLSGPQVTIVPLVVTIPGGAPTGAVFNGTVSDFPVTDGTHTGSATFIFASETGAISGWNPNVPPPPPSTNAQPAAPTSNAVYKGLAIGNNGSGNFLYAANFQAGTIDVFNSAFAPVTLPGSFTDPNVPVGFAPFGIQNIGGKLFVTYAKQDGAKHDDVAGPGNGFVDVFDTNGHLLTRLVSNSVLNSPWGLALASGSFGPVSNDLLVGNFGDGTINAFDPLTGAFVGTLLDGLGQPITIEGLWGLRFGNGGSGGGVNTLFFTAGIPGPGGEVEDHGLFGSISAQLVPEPPALALFAFGLAALRVIARRRHSQN